MRRPRPRGWRKARGGQGVRCRLMPPMRQSCLQTMQMVRMSISPACFWISPVSPRSKRRSITRCARWGEARPSPMGSLPGWLVLREPRRRSVRPWRAILGRSSCRVIGCWLRATSRADFPHPAVLSPRRSSWRWRAFISTAASLCCRGFSTKPFFSAQKKSAPSPARFAFQRSCQAQMSLAKATDVSSMRLEKPHSLSYQVRIRTKFPSMTFVWSSAKIEECGSWLKSRETSGPSV